MDFGLWVKARARHYSELTQNEYLQNPFSEWLAKVEEQLRIIKTLTEEQIVRNALESPATFKAKRLSREEINEIAKREYNEQ